MDEVEFHAPPRESKSKRWLSFHPFSGIYISNFALLTIWQFTKRRPIFGHDAVARQPTVSKSWLMRKLRGFAWESCGTQQIMHSVCTASICSVCSLCSHAFSAFVSHSKFHCFSKLKFLINGSCLWPLAGFCRIVSKFTNLATLTAFGPFEQKYMNGSWSTLYSFYSTLSLSLLRSRTAPKLKWKLLRLRMTKTNMLRQLEKC